MPKEARNSGCQRSENEREGWRSKSPERQMPGLWYWHVPNFRQGISIFKIHLPARFAARRAGRQENWLTLEQEASFCYLVEFGHVVQW